MRLNRFVAATLLATVGIALLPVSAAAQRRAVPRRAAPPPAVIVGGGYAPFYWDPWVYGGWYGQWGPGWGPGWGSGWGPGWVGGPYPYGQRLLYNGASLRVQVTPKTAEVYIDGYYAGTVDQFDGTFQRLRVQPGEHEIVVYAEGFRSFAQRLYVQPLSTVNIRQALEPLQPGDVQEVRPSPRAGATASVPGSPRRVPRGMPPARNEAEPQGTPATAPAAPGETTFGVLSVRVQPGGADVLIDGERWEGTGADERLLVQLAEGPHQVEVRRDGYQSFRRTINVRAGETETLNVSLSRQ